MNRRITVQVIPGIKQDPYLEINKASGLGAMAQEVECLSSKCEAEFNLQ
jgi:hypothetical protein